MHRGDVICQETAGGGGFGDPLDRDVDAVVADVEGGYVTVDGALESYGVVIDGGDADRAATEARRAQMREARRD
jgi:N-methylhydantoinase B